VDLVAVVEAFLFHQHKPGRAEQLLKAMPVEMVPEVT
jgi:hypothetical protein